MAAWRYVGLAWLGFMVLIVARAETGVPALRVIAPRGATSVLIGTYHGAAEGLRQPAASVFDGARRYVVEGVSEKRPDPALAAEVLGGQTQRARWASFLTSAQLAELHRRAACVEAAEGLPLFSLGASVNQSLTYASAATLSGIAAYRCAPAGLRSRDWLLRKAALAHGLTATPLESQDEADRQRNAVPEPIYVALLYDALRPEGEAFVRRAVDALNAGDYEALGQTVQDSARSFEQANVLYEIMVAQRNRTWLPRLLALLDEGDAVVAVGAYHLAGPQGLFPLLKARGYRIEAIELPAAP